MIRKLMASSAMLALVTTGAFSIAQAQTEPVEETPPAAIEQEATSTEAAGPEEGVLVPEQPTIATAFIGQNVYSSEDPESDNIGEVKDLVIGDDGMITDAIVGVGGFLGIGEKNVAVPFDELQVIERDGEIRLVYAATREQLEAAQEVEWTAYDPSARFAEEQAALQPEAPAGGMAPVDGIAPAPAPAPDVTADVDSAAAPEEETASADGVTPPEESEAAGKTEAFAGDPAAEEPDAGEQDVAATEAPTDEQPAEAEAPADEQMTETEAEAPADEQIAATETEAPADEQMAETATEAPADEQMTETEPEAPADEQMAETEAPAEDLATAETETAPFDDSAFLSFSADQVRASTLMGKEVYGPDEESIGEVSDLVLQEDGQTRAALIDVGGFLGVGEKEVAIPFDQIEVAPSAEEGGEPRLTVAMNREELEQLPTFEDRTMGSDDVAATEGAQDPTGEAEIAVETGEPSAEEDLTAETAEPAGEEDLAAETTEPTLETAGEAEMAAEEPVVAETEATDIEQPQAADEELVAEGEAAPAEAVVPEDEARALATQNLSAEELLGSAVFGADDQTLGEVGDVIFADSGQIEAVVIDVGGFLGIGEKPVAIQFDALNVQKDTNGDTTLWLNATQEQLENAPTYDENAAAQ